ncbi:MAG TPA: TIGR02453 family protein [Janthinobacterium sp.]|nr:TIGR02453 family protein [Janthinobacterium sp.]
MHLRDLTQFLKELGENNNRPWFVMNKPRYDILREEFLAVVSELILELGKFDPAVKFCNPKKAMFRINRDVRFAHDKSPYKTRFSAAIAPNDLRRPSMAGGPTYYLQIDGKGKLQFGAGEYMPPAPRLRAIREHMLNDAPGLSKVLKNKRLRDTYGSFQDEGKLQRPPKGFPADAEHIELIKLKSFFIWTEVDLKLNAPEELVSDLARGLRDALPLVNWLRAAREPDNLEE